MEQSDWGNWYNAAEIARFYDRQIQPISALTPQPDPDPARTQRLLQSMKDVAGGVSPSPLLTPALNTGVTQDIRDLRQRSESEKKPERAVTLKRALAGIFIGAIESGSGALEKKECRTAERYFSAAAEARPHSEWPLRQLAIAQALAKDRKAALETLRRIKPADGPEFQNWLAAEPAFQILRGKQGLPL